MGVAPRLRPLSPIAGSPSASYIAAGEPQEAREHLVRRDDTAPRDGCGFRLARAQVERRKV